MSQARILSDMLDPQDLMAQHSSLSVSYGSRKANGSSLAGSFELWLHVDELCCSLKSNKIPNQIIVRPMDRSARRAEHQTGCHAR